MSREITRRAGFALRMLSLGAFSCMALFAALVVIQNEELAKLVPVSTARTLSILFAYIVAMITFNYALAIKGRNFMGWKSESLVMLGFILVFVGMFLPHAFPVSGVVETKSWLPFVSKQQLMFKPDWRYSGIAALSIPFLFKGGKEIVALFRERRDSSPKNPPVR